MSLILSAPACLWPSFSNRRWGHFGLCPVVTRRGGCFISSGLLLSVGSHQKSQVLEAVSNSLVLLGDATDAFRLLSSRVSKLLNLYFVSMISQLLVIT